MGKYINETSNGRMGSSFNDKVSSLSLDGAIKIDPPNKFEEGLVCVVDNYRFAAAAYCEDEKEMNRFLNGRYGRNWQWFKWDKAKEFAE